MHSTASAPTVPKNAALGTSSRSDAERVSAASRPSVSPQVEDRGANVADMASRAAGYAVATQGCSSNRSKLNLKFLCV